MSIMSFVGLAAAFYLLKLLFQSLSWWAIAGLVLLFVSWIGMMLARIVANQEGLLYQPHPQVPGSVMGKTPADNPPFFRSPHEHGLAYEDVSLTTADGERLHAWFLPVAPHAYPQDPTSPLHNTPGVAPSVAVAAAAAAIASASSNASSSDTAAAGSAGGAAAKAPASPYSRHVPTVLYLHENAGNMGMRLFNLRLLLTRLHCNVLILSYRGYGASSGAPSERGLVADADAALRHLALRPDIDPARIFLFGRSLGGAVAIAAAARHPELVRGVVVENSFASINLLVDSIFPILAPVKERVLRLRWFSDRRAPAIRAPVCFVAAQQDEVVPAAHADRLLEAATGAPARMHVSFAAGGHTDLWFVGGSQYLDALRHFIYTVCEATLPAPPLSASGNENSSEPGNSGWRGEWRQPAVSAAEFAESDAVDAAVAAATKGADAAPVIRSFPAQSPEVHKFDTIELRRTLSILTNNGASAPEPGPASTLTATAPLGDGDEDDGDRREELVASAAGAGARRSRGSGSGAGAGAGAGGEVVRRRPPSPPLAPAEPHEASDSDLEDASYAPETDDSDNAQHDDDDGAGEDGTGDGGRRNSKSRAGGKKKPSKAKAAAAAGDDAEAGDAAAGLRQR